MCGLYQNKSKMTMQPLGSDALEQQMCFSSVHQIWGRLAFPLMTDGCEGRGAVCILQLPSILAVCIQQLGLDCCDVQVDPVQAYALVGLPKSLVPGTGIGGSWLSVQMGQKQRVVQNRQG